MNNSDYLQSTIYDFLYNEFKITKPIRIIELFAGYGSQFLALKYLGANVEHYKICEWAIKSIQAYNDLHIQDYNDYSKDLDDDEIINKLLEYGVSANYNDPATIEQIKRQNYRKIYNNIIATNNLVNVSNVKGKDLEIIDTDIYIYILTYSFPCQDLSLAGKGKGMSDTSTRSGLLWEVERILKECKKIDQLPQVLLMENVPQVHGVDNVEDFNKWQLELEKLGYKNYFKDLIATDYGIPQTRNRCFMVSILGNYNYTFPKPIPLKLKLKDMLENNVNEKYYLSDKTIKFFYENEKKQKEKGNGFKFGVTNGDNVAKTITTRAGSRMDDNFITNKSLRETLEKNIINDTCYIDTYNRKINNEKAGTITTGVNYRNNTFLAEKEDNICVGTYQYAKSDKFMQGKSRLQLGKEVSDTIQTSQKEGIVNNNLRIRKLTPKECFRLMGVKDEDFEKIRKNQSDSSLYHLAGDSIVVNVLMAIFKQMLK